LKPRRSIDAHSGSGTKMGINPTPAKRTPMILSAVALIPARGRHLRRRDLRFQ
jgi:hypothetical protein